MKDISPILKSLGLLDSEVKTYLSALENGPGTVIDHVKATRLSRQAVYVAIDALTERGLMSSVLRGKKRVYAADHPEKLLAYAQRRQSEVKSRVEDLQRMLPELELQAGGEKPIVKLYEGKEGLRAVILDMQDSKAKENLEIADLEAMNAILAPEDLAPMRAELKKVGAHVRGLYAGAPTGRTLSSDRWDLPKEFAGFKSNITVYGDKVALVTFVGKLYSVIIESAPLAKGFRALFEMAIRGAKDLPKV